jgi:tagatose-6-phosphate ketose/aldose isomerase
MTEEVSILENPLQTLLHLSDAEKVERGLQHTPREIWQQPETWKTTYQRCQNLRTELLAVLDRSGVGSGKNNAPPVYLVGAGTSDYVGRAIAPLLRQHWQCNVWPVPSTTLLTDFEEFHQPGREYLWISFSRSGESPEGVALLERALEQHPYIRHVVITCNQQGAMAKLCGDHSDRAFALVLDDAVNDRGLAMTSSFTNMVVAGQCLADLENLPQYGDRLNGMAEAGSKFLVQAAEVAAAITGLGCTRACFVGTGALQAVAKESALKLAELTAGRKVTMAESALGLRHGPMSSIDGQSLFTAFISSDPQRHGYEVDLLQEICRKRLGRVRAVVTAGRENEVAPFVDYCLSLNCPSDFPDEYRPPLDIILGQLLGLFSSLSVGLKPDQPSPTGAITRVVSPIKIYA